MLGNPHDTIRFFSKVISYPIDKIKALYKQGLSLREIERRIGISKTKVRKILLQNGAVIRDRNNGNGHTAWRKSGKGNVKPPYGFCYFEGRLVKDQKEYPILLTIYERWKSGHTPSSIADVLNRQKIPSPMKKTWSWNSIVNVINRFKSGTIAVGKEGLEITKLT